MNRYATEDARVALMYRLLVGTGGSTAVVAPGLRQPEFVSYLIARPDPQPVFVSAELLAGVAEAGKPPIPQGHFDRLILHSVIFARPRFRVRGQEFESADLLAAAIDALRPGAIVAGVIKDHRGRVRCIGRGVTAAGDHVSALQAAGLVDAEVFIVLPAHDAPVALVSAKPSVLRRYLLANLYRNRARLGSVGWCLRWVAIQSGLAFCMHTDFAFRARKPCST